MLQNAYFLAKIGADTAENERHVAENLPKIGNEDDAPATPGAVDANPAPPELDFLDELLGEDMNAAESGLG